MDLRRQLRVFRASWPVLVAGALVAAAVAFVVFSAQPRSYEARATLIVGRELSGANPDYTQLLVSQRLSTTYAAIATTQRILDPVIERVGLTETSTELARRVEATASTDSSLLTISVRDTNPDRVVAIANAIAEELVSSSPGLDGEAPEGPPDVSGDLATIRDQITRTQTDVDELAALESPSDDERRRLEVLQGQLVTLWSSYTQLLSVPSAEPANLLTIVQPATLPEEPVGPRPELTAILGALLGLLVTAAVVFTVDLLNDRVRTADDVRELIDLPTLGTIQRMKARAPLIYQLATLLYPRSSAAEAYRSLRTNVEFAAGGQLRSLLVTSALPREGKTVTAANLAVAFAQAGRRVVLVDGDLRRGGVSRIFRLEQTEGLSTLLRMGRTKVPSVIQETEDPGLHVLPAGPVPPNPSELLASPRMRTIVSELLASYDLVVVDSPPVGSVADAAVIGSITGLVLLVVDVQRSQRTAVRRARETLDRANATILGVVLNGFPVADAPDYYDESDPSTPRRARGRAGTVEPVAGGAPD